MICMVLVDKMQYHRMRQTHGSWPRWGHDAPRNICRAEGTHTMQHSKMCPGKAIPGLQAPTSRCSSRNRRSGVALKAARRVPLPPRSTWYCCCRMRSEAGLSRLRGGKRGQGGGKRKGAVSCRVGVRVKGGGSRWGGREGSSQVGGRREQPGWAAGGPLGAERHRQGAQGTGRQHLPRHAAPAPRGPRRRSPQHHKGALGAAHHQAAAVQRVHHQPGERLAAAKVFTPHDAARCGRC